MSFCIYILASVAMALIVLGGLVLVMSGSADDKIIADACRRKRELDAEREDFRQASDRSDASDSAARKWREKP